MIKYKAFHTTVLAPTANIELESVFFTCSCTFDIHTISVITVVSQTCFLKQLANFDIIGIANQAQFINGRQRTAFKVQRWL